MSIFHSFSAVVNTIDVTFLMSTNNCTFLLFIIETDITFWRELKNQGGRYPGTSDDTIAVSKYTVEAARKFLAEIYNVTIDEILPPKYAVMSLWDSYPYGASWYSWRPGYNWDKVTLNNTTVIHLIFAASTFGDFKRLTWCHSLILAVSQSLSI